MEKLLNQINEKYNYNPKLSNISTSFGETYLTQVLLNNHFPETDDLKLLELYGLYFAYVEPNHEKTCEYFEKAISLGSVDAMCYYGNYWRLERKSELCIKYFEMAIEHGCLDSIFNLANYYHTKKNSLCVKYYMMGVEREDEECTLKLSDYYYHIKDWENYEKILLLYIKHNPKNAYNWLGLLYDKNGNKKAEEYYLKAIEHGNVSALYNLGRHYYDVNDYKNMKKYYKLAMEQNETSSMFDLAIYYKYKPQKVRKALQYAEMYHNLLPKDVDGINTLGEILEQLHEYTKMKTIFQKGIELNNITSIINMATFHNKRLEYKEAIEYYLKSYKLNHFKSPQFLGQCYEKLEEYEQAEKYFLIGLKKGDSICSYYLCQIYRKTKQYKKMIEQLYHSYKHQMIPTLNSDLEATIHFAYFSASTGHNQDYYVDELMKQFDSIPQNLIEKYNKELKDILNCFYNMKYQKLRLHPKFKFTTDVTF